MAMNESQGFSLPKGRLTSSKALETPFRLFQGWRINPTDLRSDFLDPVQIEGKPEHLAHMGFLGFGSLPFSLLLCVLMGLRGHQGPSLFFDSFFVYLFFVSIRLV